MDVVIGLGGAGGRIAELFKRYPEYEVYKMDVGIRGHRNFSFSAAPDMVSYEKQAVSRKEKLSDFFEDISEGDTVLFIVAGGGKVAGASLAILEHLQGTRVRVLFVEPDVEFLSLGQLENMRLTRGVLQEYSRSGLFETMYLVSNTSLEAVIGDVPINSYNNQLNDTIASTMAMVRFFENTEPILDSRGSPRDTTRLATFGVTDFDHPDQVVLMYPLSGTKDKIYFYGMSKEELETDGSLLRKIKSHTKAIPVESGETLTFAVYETTYDKNMILCCLRSDKVQE
jgi:hypothetical protein